MCYCPTPTLHLNLALTGDGAFILSLKTTHSVWFISVLNYGDTENVLINHLLLVIPMSYPCHYTNLCPHKPHKHAHTHTHNTTHTHTEQRCVPWACCTGNAWPLRCTGWPSPRAPDSRPKTETKKTSSSAPLWSLKPQTRKNKPL